MIMEYTYRGDKLTDPRLKGQPCSAVRRPDGKCIRGKNGNMLVRFARSETVVVLGRQLKKIPEKSLF
jgi:hypothetical protein